MDKLDILILGATGFTGNFVAKKLALLTKQEDYKNVRWGISGRSDKKIKNLLREIQNTGTEVFGIPVIEFDITKQANTLTELTAQAKIVINATGPNTILSPPIVNACIQTGTHYVDISAELYHMIKIYRDFHKEAVKSNLLIVPCCGFANIPVAAGLMHLEKQFEGTLHTVECYVELKLPLRSHNLLPFFDNTVMHHGTWHSLVYEMKNFRKYVDLKKNTFPIVDATPDKLQKPFFHKNKGKIWYPYPGPDGDLVEQTQIYRREDGKSPYYLKIYTTMPLLIDFLIIVPLFFLYYVLCRLACFRKLLVKFPKFFTAGLVSHKGPTEKMRKDTNYSFTLCGKGWEKSAAWSADMKSAPAKSLTVKVSGEDPGYETTAICLICAALTLLKDRSDMPAGGVLPPGTAFEKTQLVDRLLKTNNINIECIDNK